MALRRRNRDRHHVGDVSEFSASGCGKAQMDVEHDFTGDDEVVIEGESIEGEVHHALDRVLNRYETEVDVAVGHGVEHIGNGAHRQQLPRRKVALGAQRLLGEGAERPEERDTEGVGVRCRFGGRCVHPGKARAAGPWACHDVAMDAVELAALVDAIRAGELAPDDAVARLRRLPFAEVGDALVDHHRALRQGMPEAVYGPGKSAEQCVAIIGELLENGSGAVLLTRANETQVKAVRAVHDERFTADVSAGCVLYRAPDVREPQPRVLVVTAGTADVPVADEAAFTLRAHGIVADRLHDVGVAGLHRLLAHIDRVTAADAVIVIAGMEGALASVIGGLAAGPVVAVPTSVGYGAGLEGITALLAMHASCASGVSVVGIDNGFGAATAVVRMLTLARS